MRSESFAEIAKLQTEDLVALTKAVAAYEDTVGGLGSVTALKRLLPLVPDENHQLIDWLLRNTNSYWWYGNGAKSFEELQAMRLAHAEDVAGSLEKEKARAEAAKARRAERATGNLFNAVRRGDFKAVQALLVQGASVNTGTPDGRSLGEYAKAKGFLSIAALLGRSEG